ncbi:rod shape-determining protein MreD [Chryseomicrobium sp. FSL W7-1435]|uniref:rod shape-determining protein MreD n=1 Tax=Chryseomicrobium sp. FSL W7-1435 TaxID=2921704 RepID=UPI003159E4C2
MIRFLVIFIALFLFYMEPVFGLLSPVSIGPEFYILVPRFLIIYLVFVAIYYNRKRAIILGVIFGLLYDVFFIDIIGLYSFIYPILIAISVWVMRHVHLNVLTLSLLLLMLLAGLESLLFVFNTIIGTSSLLFDEFLQLRLLPTMLANLVFVVATGWFFKWLLVQRYEQKYHVNT